MNWKWILICTAIFSCLAGYSFWQNQFRLSNINFVDWDTNSFEQNQNSFNTFKASLNQRFFYLDRGKQSFAFSSEDGRFVLKLFDTSRMKSWMEKKDENSINFHKYQQLMEGYKLAYAYAPQLSGLLYVQLKPENLDPIVVTLVDRFGFQHHIDLSQVPFALQLKAVPLRHLITQLLGQGNVGEAKQRLRQMVDFYVSGYQQGIYDKDSNFMYNTGFADDVPLRLDVGRLYLDKTMQNPAVYMKNLRKIAIKRCGGWLKRHFPAYREEIIADLREKLSELDLRSRSQ